MPHITLVTGDRRSGKTHETIRRVVEHAATGEKRTGDRYVIVTPDLAPGLNRLFIEVRRMVAKQLAPHLRGFLSDGEDTAVGELKNGAIFIVTLDRDFIRHGSFLGVALVEAERFAARTATDAIYAVAEKDGRVWIEGNPPREAGGRWFRRLQASIESRETNGEVVRLAYSNPHVDSSARERVRQLAAIIDPDHGDLS